MWINTCNKVKKITSSGWFSSDPRRDDKTVKKISKKNGKECWLQRFPMASLPLELAVLVRPLIGYSGSNDWKAPLRPLCSPSPTHRQKCPDLIPDIMTTSLCQLLAPCLQLPLAQFLTHMEVTFSMFNQLWPVKPKWGKKPQWFCWSFIILHHNVGVFRVSNPHNMS